VEPRNEATIRPLHCISDVRGFFSSQRCDEKLAVWSISFYAQRHTKEISRYVIHRECRSRENKSSLLNELGFGCQNHIWKYNLADYTKNFKEEKMMQERWKELQELLEEMTTMKKREYFLIMAVCVLSGLVVGMFLSPKKMMMIGSNNGNNNVTNKEKEKKRKGDGEDKVYDWED
jgi:flagellar biosynthesis/type III secretory pathway chaperone